MNTSEITAVRYLGEAKYYLKQGDYTRALDYIEKSITYGNWSDSFSIRANIYLKMGKLDEAIKDFKKSTTMAGKQLEGGIGNDATV